jgi:hypothetical protein
MKLRENEIKAEKEGDADTTDKMSKFKQQANIFRAMD